MIREDRRTGDAAEGDTGSHFFFFFPSDYLVLRSLTRGSMSVCVFSESKSMDSEAGGLHRESGERRESGHT